MKLILKAFTSHVSVPDKVRVTVNGLSHHTPSEDIVAINREVAKRVKVHTHWQFQGRLSTVVPTDRTAEALKALRRAVATITERDVEIHYTEHGKQKVIKTDGTVSSDSQQATAPQTQKLSIPPCGMSSNARRERNRRHNR